MKVRRFSLSGEEVFNSQWPWQSVHSSLLCLAGGVPWALQNAAIPLDASERKSVGGLWSNRATGLAEAPSSSASPRFWLATTQGLLAFKAKDLKEPLFRLGGLGCPELLCAGPDFSLFVYSAGRFLRLGIDGEAAALPHSGPEEPFRLGANWRSHAAAALCVPGSLLALDSKEERLWELAFDPSSARGFGSWRALTAQGSFPKPQSLAFDGRTLYVSCAEGFFSSDAFRSGQFVKAQASLKGLLTANASTPGFFQIDSGRLVSYAPSLAPRWSVELDASSVSGFAAGESFLALSDAKKGEIKLLSAVDGKELCVLSSSAVPGGMAPGGVSLAEPWLFVADTQGSRVLRFRIR
jgi:hypothetical protein